ncbi:hypothetical protein niasHT_005734 [Heterodera trifolii]|uniref:Uncharacterized protein n=1 Tax=Heterodera trifolii TaxID=157864 RepID=A0ABD2LYS3_9BILA
MSDRRKEAEEKMEKAIFISNDCWLCVFDLLSPRQLGLGIAMISHRFDFYVDEHFKTRKWTFGTIQFGGKIGENGTKQMEIVNSDGGIPLPIPQVQLPRKVIGFKQIEISFIDRNVIAFLHHFRPLFAACQIILCINTDDDRNRMSELIFRNIWPMLGKNIHSIEITATVFRRFRQMAPSILNEYPSLRFVIFYDGDLFTEFPADDSAAASDGQVLAKWLFTPLQNNVPKMLVCSLDKDDAILASKIETFKATFANASSPANFIVVIWLSFASSVVPFALTNELTSEQLALKRANNSNHFLLVRCPIVRNVSKWAKWEEEALGWEHSDQWNQIYIEVFRDYHVGDGLLDEIPDPSDLLQQT